VSPSDLFMLEMSTMFSMSTSLPLETAGKEVGCPCTEAVSGVSEPTVALNGFIIDPELPGD